MRLDTILKGAKEAGYTHVDSGQTVDEYVESLKRWKRALPTMKCDLILTGEHPSITCENGTGRNWARGHMWLTRSGAK